MAKLTSSNDERSVELTSEHTIGRSRSNRLRLRDDRVSGQHAVLRWTGEGWEIRDLGSRNGTWVDGRRLSAGERRVLGVGGEVSFGSASAAWRVVDDAPPVATASGPGGARRRADEGLLLLPDADQPELCIYSDDRGRWIAERGLEERVVEDGDALESSGGLWTVYLPRQIVSTRSTEADKAVDLNRLSVTLAVSRDEEHVEIWLDGAGETRKLPHRAHGYLLLTLARARLSDRSDPDLSVSERGWLYQEDLCQQLRIPPAHFNVALYRARRQFAQAGVFNAQRLIERRRGSGQLRLGVERFSVRSL